jgi:actin-related protein
MQSAMSGIHPEDNSGERKKQLMASVKKKLMSVKERRDKGKTHARDREREKEKEREKETIDKGKDRERERAAKQLQEKERAYQQQQAWHQAETSQSLQGIEKLKELDKESKRNKKNKALEEMAAFALTVLSKFNALSESALSEARERERRMSSGGGGGKGMSQSGSHAPMKVTPPTSSGVAGSKSHSASTQSVPTTPSHELSLKVGMHIGRAMVGSIPFALASPSGGVGTLHSACARTSVLHMLVCVVQRWRC